MAYNYFYLFIFIYMPKITATSRQSKIETNLIRGPWVTLKPLDPFLGLCHRRQSNAVNCHRGAEIKITNKKLTQLQHQQP